MKGKLLLSLVFLGISQALLLVGLLDWQWGRARPIPDLVQGIPYPQPRSGWAEQGAKVYQRLGCAECHTRQVLSWEEGPDRIRGWGRRKSVARDYLYDRPLLWGTLRIGRDLANIGLEMTNRLVVLQRLWAFHGPNGSVQAARYPELFLQTQHPQQVRLQNPWLPMIYAAAGDRPAVFGSWEGMVLAEYLRSLRMDGVIPEVLPWLVSQQRGSTTSAPPR